MIIEISNGKGRIYHHRNYFAGKGMKFEKRSYGKSFYTKKVSEPEQQELVAYCNENKLKYLLVKESHLRNSTYRKEFLKTQKHKWTLCAYCGLPVRTSEITVDHIIPVDKVKKTRYAKWMLKRLHIENVNELRNLAGACERCNSRKRTRMGLWVLSGFLGKSIVLWCIRWLLRILMIGVVTVMLAT